MEHYHFVWGPRKTAGTVENEEIKAAFPLVLRKSVAVVVLAEATLYIVIEGE